MTREKSWKQFSKLHVSYWLELGQLIQLIQCMDTFETFTLEFQFTLKYKFEFEVEFKAFLLLKKGLNLQRLIVLENHDYMYFFNF